MSRLRSCTQLKALLRLDLGDRSTRNDGDHCNFDVLGKEVGGAVVHDVEPPVATEPSEQLLNSRP